VICYFLSTKGHIWWRPLEITKSSSFFAWHMMRCLLGSICAKGQKDRKGTMHQLRPRCCLPGWTTNQPDNHSLPPEFQPESTPPASFTCRGTIAGSVITAHAPSLFFWQTWTWFARVKSHELIDDATLTWVLRWQRNYELSYQLLLKSTSSREYFSSLS
jgi:hypothetical protein